MKTFILLLGLACSLLAISAEDAAFVLDYHDNYKTALSKAKSEDRLLMLFIVQDPCPYCERQVNDTLSDIRVVKSLKELVCVVVDKHSPLPSAFKTQITPMTFFIDPNSEEGIWESFGYVSVELFLDDIQEAKNIRIKGDKNHD